MKRARAALAILAAAGFACVMTAFLAPACAAILPAFGDGGFRLSGSRIPAALRFTVMEAILSSVAAVAIGLPAAFLVARRSFPGRRLLLALSGVPLCIPPVIIALAFVLFYGRNGYLNATISRLTGNPEPTVTFLYSLAGVVIAHGFYNFPVVLRTVSQVWERLPEAEEDAATLLGAGRARVFLTITLPRLSGAIFASGALVFLYCFFSFIIVLLFGGIGGTTLEVELYQAARASFDFRAAGSIALVETVVAIGIVVAYAALERRLSAGSAGLGSPRERKRVRGFGETFAVAAYLAFLLVFFIGPLASILVRSCMESSLSLYSGATRFGLGAWARLLSRSGLLKASLTTVGIGLAVAFLSTLAALFFALAGTELSAKGEHSSRMGRVGTELGKNLARASRVLPLSPLAVSSVILGFGWTLLVPRGNAFVLVLAQSALAWPFAWTQIQSSLDRVPRALRDAAFVLSPDPLDRAFRAFVPLCRRGIVSGAGFAFAISAGDASLPLVLSLGRFENLSLLLYRLVGSYRFSEACACAVVLALLSGMVFFLQDSGSARGGRAGTELDGSKPGNSARKGSET